MSNRSSILRWALPPGVSLVIHAGLVVLLIVVGSRAAVIAANQSAKISLPLAELEYIARPLVVQDATEPNDVSVRASGRAVVRADQPVARAAASVLDRSAMSLAALGSVSSQAMSAATLEQLAQQSSWLSDEPSSVPAPISFAGVSTGAVRSIVYVIDASGATLTSLGYIRQRLLQSIDRLSPTQRFQVIAFRQLGESTHTLPELSSSRNKLPRATRANKQAVADWLADMPAQGRSNPVDGLAAALAFKPDMILLISRGITRTEAPWEGGLGAVRERLDELNPLDLIKGTRPVVIKTIQLLNEDPTGIMRTIGVFHGDGHNDHQVITYAQLVSPDPVPQARPSSDMDAWLTTVEDQLAGLKASGSYYRATTSLATDADRSEIEQAMVRINAVLRKADSGDGRAALLGGESLLVSGEVEESEALMYIEALGDAVFVSPELDGRRRIVVAQLYGRVGDLEAAIGELLSLLEEREALGLSTVSWGHGVLVLGSLMELDSVGFDQEPFTTDPAWALMLAQARSVFRLSGGREDAFWPLLELRKVLPAHEALIDASIARMLDGDDVDLMVFPDLVRFIFARSVLTGGGVGGVGQRMGAIQALRLLGSGSDRALAEESLWLACLGARAINTRESGEVLMLAAAELARRFPGHEGAGDALAGAIDVANEYGSVNLVPLLRQVIAQYPDRIEIDLWRLGLIELTQGQERLALIMSLTPATRESDMGAEIYHALELRASPADRLGQASGVAAALDELDSPLANYWHRIAAGLEVGTNPASAVERLGGIVQKNVSLGDPDLELLYAGALLGAGRSDDALLRLTALAGLLNTNPNKHFWHAWTLILETIAVEGNAADRESALAHLTRLGLMDPELGPEPFRSRLIKASNTLHSEP